MTRRESITAKYLRECLHYNELTGVFTWRERPLEHFVDKRTWKTWNTRFSGKTAGPNGGMCNTSKGYIQISINNRLYLVHRLAWLYMTGELPKDQIDHADGDKLNNAFANLREATNAQNHANMPMPSHNASGFKGVYFDKRAKKYQANIKVNGIKKYLGSFDAPEAAHEAYCEAACEAHGEFARTS
jgi:hypothetical protein